MSRHALYQFLSSIWSLLSNQASPLRPFLYFSHQNSRVFFARFCTFVGIITRSIGCGTFSFVIFVWKESRIERDPVGKEGYVRGVAQLITQGFPTLIGIART